MTTNPFPPRPSVEHLLTVFRRIDAGKILIPAFQRAFVWKDAQILDLLESVYSGYPVGSILLWNVDRPVLKISTSSDIPFPNVKVQYPVDFVLDGLQRLSTLYGVFHFGEATQNEKFNVGFNLRDKRFEYRNDDVVEPHVFVSLNALFNPRALLEVQQRLLKFSVGDDLVQTVLTLQSRFQEYMLPLVTLTERNPAEVVSIFERVNSTGTRLSRVDFMRAITWSSQFDLNDALDSIGDDLRDKDFDISDDTIVKALGLTFNLDPVPDVMLSLKDKSAGALDDAVKKTKTSFAAVVEFLEDDVKIMGSDFVPYEGQLLSLFNVFDKIRDVDEVARHYLRKWFFRISIAESLQGRPDHYVARLIRTITSRIERRAFEEFDPETIVKQNLDWIAIGNRRLIKGKALSVAFVSLFGLHGARSFIDGRIIPRAEYLRTFDTASFVPIFPKAELPSGFGGDGLSAKVLSNIVLVPPSDLPVIRGASALPIVRELYSSDRPNSDEIIASQLLPPRKSANIDEAFQFLEYRSEMIGDLLQQLSA